jgi:hypothetical protein
LKKLIGGAAALMFLPFPRVAALLALLWMFWEELGDLTLGAYDDYQVMKTETALKESPSANVKAYYVHMLTMRSVAERRRRGRAQLVQKPNPKAAFTARARAAATRVRHLIERGETVPMGAATGEE